MGMGRVVEDTAVKFRRSFHFYPLKMEITNFFEMFYCSEKRHGVRPKTIETGNFCGSQTSQERHCCLELHLLGYI